MAHGHQHGAQQQGPFPLPGVSNIIAVGSGKGGVGKTTIAVNLAVALAKMGYKTGLLDADVYGPNVPLMMHTSQQPRVLNENLIEPLQNYGVKIISPSCWARRIGANWTIWWLTFLPAPATL